ncbi:hypothetical protein V5799_031515 [Amblyomma americanum]|uniref:Uncharacterized protein n=1 Tax=Amblyomma americanum TaxID=6943 RepID=A0AAQ4EK05_AMBAM
MPHILMLAAGNAQSVSRPFINIRDKVISFVGHVLRSCEESLKDSFEDVIIILIHNLAFHAVDRIDFRLKTAQAVLMLMGDLSEERFKRVVQWFIRLTMVPMANRRVFELEMILALIWDERVAYKRSELLLAAMKRCNDKAATVKTNALSVLASVTNESPELWVPLLKVSNPVEPGGEGEREVEDDCLSQLMQVLKYRTEDCKVSQGPFREYHKYLQQAVLQLHRAEKVWLNQLNSLKTHVGGANDASVWLLLSKLSICCDLGQGNFAFNHWKQHWEEHPEGSSVLHASNETLNHVLIVLKKVSCHLSSNTLRELIVDME